MANKRKTIEEFSFDIIEKVWEKAEIIPGFDPAYLRKDKCGAVIARVFYGKCRPDLPLGWEINFIKPLTQGGTDNLANLQPLQWENNRNKTNPYPSRSRRVSMNRDGSKYLSA